uniref:WW domain-containing protein n=1 Tax=Triparma pacifica TaxID=91992 RepID=A0A7S2QVW0_9STRA|mmetsp:Transcript_1091/g.2003  ORF Transcript_1091/g.2003 Transcript_1091/m.2003 type:complete len:321 (+) Transcript_1091:59-1021(+)
MPSGGLTLEDLKRKTASRLHMQEVAAQYHNYPTLQQQQQQQQRQQYGQQQGGQYGQQQQQQQQQRQQPQANPTNPALPPGWIAMQDPSSGRTYYANQQTGATTWDPPPMPMPAAPVPQPQVMQPPVPTQPNPTTPSKPFNGANLANKYGDGFVSSASNPELAAQYGNIGTANPYNGAARPAGANVAGSSTGTPHHVPSQAAATPEPAPAVQEIPPEMMTVVNGLKGIVDQLQGVQLAMPEKKQLGEISKGCEILYVKLATPNAIDQDTGTKLQTLVAALQNRDYATAGSMSTVLANTVWKQHKDFLKGIKYLIQLAGKKL